jgi:hypothetical protein
MKGENMQIKRVQKCMRQAIWAVQNFVMDNTGKRPTQDEIAMALRPYLVLHEITEHIKTMRDSSETGE